MRLAMLAAVALVACATPPILVDPTPHPCGEWPVECGDGTCCPEHNACVLEPDGTPGCEYVGPDGVRRLRPRAVVRSGT